MLKQAREGIHAKHAPRQVFRLSLQCCPTKVNSLGRPLQNTVAFRVCVCVCCAHVGTYSTHTYMCAHTLVHTGTHTCSHTHACTWMHAPAWRHTYAASHVHICTHMQAHPRTRTRTTEAPEAFPVAQGSCCSVGLPSPQ